MRAAGGSVGDQGLYIGQPDEGGAVVASLKELGRPAADLVAPMPYTAFQAMVDPFAPGGC